MRNKCGRMLSMILILALVFTSVDISALAKSYETYEETEGKEFTGEENASEAVAVDSDYEEITGEGIDSLEENDYDDEEVFSEEKDTDCEEVSSAEETGINYDEDVLSVEEKDNTSEEDSSVEESAMEVTEDILTVEENSISLEADLLTEEEEEILEAGSYGLSNPRISDGKVTWDCVWFGNYYQKDTNGDGKADTSDKKEPIKWRVLSVDGDDAFLLADYELDSQRYNKISTYVTWETCTLRSWLNGYGASINTYGTDYSSDNFIGKAFNSSEQSAIIKKTIENADNPTIGTEGGNNTSDKVFLLSLADVTNTKYGFSSDKEEYDPARWSKASDYAEAQGAYIDSFTNEDYVKYNGNCSWWLRSPGNRSSCAADVESLGCAIDFALVGYDGYAVRPALHLNLSSSSVWSKAGTVTSDGTASETAPGTGGGSGEPQNSKSGKAGDNVNWEYDDIITLYFDGSGDMQDYANYLSPKWSNYSKKIYVVIIDEGITSIGSHTFGSLKNLLSVKIPKTVTKISASAFDDAVPFIINFDGTEEEWDKMAAPDLEYIAVKFSDGTVKQKKQISGKFQYYRTMGFFAEGSTEKDFYIDYNWFDEHDGYTYNHDLARMALRVTMAACNDKDKITDILDNMKFQYTDSSICLETPKNDSIGSSIAHKRLYKEDGSYDDLILVVIRSYGYGAEWASNVTVGDSGNHQGFDDAAEEVLIRLNTYLGRENITGDKLKVWIMGYSRGAATANLLASKLDDGRISKIDKENIYAYCFECPQNTVSLSSHQNKYQNIFNIVNDADIVTKVAMSNNLWTFRRFGCDIQLPTVLNDFNFYKLKKEMVAEYQDILVNGEYSKNTPNKYSTEKLLEMWSDDNILKQGMTDKLLDGLTILILTRGDYYNNYQDLFREIMAETNEGQQENVLNAIYQFAVLADSLFNPYDISPKAIKNKIAIKNLLNICVVGATAGWIVNDVDEASDYLLYISPHFPELCLAWMDSIEIENAETWYGRKYEKYCINCPVDIEVYDDNNNLVAAIYNNQVKEIEDGIACYIDSDGQKVFVIPENGNYSVKYIGNDDGEMTCTILEYEGTDMQPIAIESYRNLELEKGLEYLGTSVSGNVILKDSDGEVILADVILNADEIVTYEVSCNIVGYGDLISAGGIYYPGEFCELVASTSNNAIFKNWSIDGKIVSEEPVYRFMVTENTLVSANFELYRGITFDPNGGKITTSANGVTVSSNGYGYKNISQNATYGELPEAEKEFFSFDGWYTDAVSGNRITAESVFTSSENQVLYAHWIEKTYTVSSSAIGEGTIKLVSGNTISNNETASGNVIKVKAGEKLIYSISANAGNTISDVLVDGKSVGAVESYELKDISADHEIVAIIGGPLTHKVTLTKADGTTASFDVTNGEIYGKRLQEVSGMTEGVIYNGMYFAGWENNKGESITKDTVIDLQGDIVIKPIWEYITIVTGQKFNVEELYHSVIKSYPDGTKFKYVAENVEGTGKATVSSKGLLTGKKEGLVKVTLMAKEKGGVYEPSTAKSVYVAILKPVVTKKMVYVGQTIPETDIIHFENGQAKIPTLPNVSSFQYEKSNSNISYDSSYENLTANSAGTTKYTYYFKTIIGKKSFSNYIYSTIKKTVVVTVKDPSFAKKSYTVKSGKNLKMSLKNVIKGTTVTYSSDNEKVLSVVDSSKGIFTAGETGTAKVTATLKYGDYVLTRTMTVTVQ